MKIYKFRNFTLDPLERSVFKGDRHIDLTPRTFDILQLLVKRPGRILSKDEILETVWGGSFVEEGNLPVQISKLRSLLGETKSERFIETVSGVGYRFISSVKILNEAERSEHVLNGEIEFPNVELKPVSRNFESHRLFLKGSYFLDKRTPSDVYKAINHFQQSISNDEENLHSYVAIVNSYYFLYSFGYISRREARSRMQPWLDKLPADDCSDSDLQLMHARLSLVFDWEFVKFREHCRHALALNTRSVAAHSYYAKSLVLAGDYSEAIAHITAITTLDPLSANTYTLAARLLYFLGFNEKALFYLNEALELNSESYEALALKAVILSDRNNYPEALALFEKSLKANFNLDVLGLLGILYARLGKNTKAYRIIKHAESGFGGGAGPTVISSGIYLAFGQKERTYSSLEKAIDNHTDPDLIALTYDPRWRSIRKEARFKDLVSRVGMPFF